VVTGRVLGHLRVHPASEEVRADGSLAVVDGGVDLLVGDGPVETAVSVGDAASSEVIPA
jgi:hypothetical protein